MSFKGTFQPKQFNDSKYIWYRYAQEKGAVDVTLCMEWELVEIR